MPKQINPTVLDFEIVQGQDQGITLVSEGVTAEGNPFPTDLSEYETWFAELRDDADSLTNCPQPASVTAVRSGANGEVTLNFARGATEKGSNPNLVTQGKYAVEVTDTTSGERQRVFEGRWTVSAEVTQI